MKDSEQIRKYLFAIAVYISVSFCVLFLIAFFSSQLTDDGYHMMFVAFVLAVGPMLVSFLRLCDVIASLLHEVRLKRGISHDVLCKCIDEVS